MRNLLIGQSHDLLWTHLLVTPSVDQYLKMVDGSKPERSFSLLIGVMQEAAVLTYVPPD